MIWSCLRLASVIAAIDPQCQALIDANTQTLELIRTVQVHYTNTLLDSNKRRLCEIWWARDGRRERIRRVGGPIDPTADGRPRDIDDLLIDGDTYKYLQNWDPRNPQKITPTHQGTLRASTGPQTNENAFLVAPTQDLLLELDQMPRRTLGELAKVSPRVVYKGKAELDGRELHVLALETPEETTERTIKRYFDAYLDPAAGYMIRRVVVNAPKVALAGGRSTKFQCVREVVEFRDFGGGIFVGTRIRNGTPDKWASEIAVDSIEVNGSLAPDTFRLDWPKYAAVTHHPPVNGKFRVEIWGKDEPIAEIKKVSDLRAVETELRKDPLIAAELGALAGGPPPAPTSVIFKLSFVLGVLVAVMVALVLYRRIREQAAA